MKTSSLYRLTYIYLALPLFLFFLTWLRPEIAVLIGLLYGVAFYFSYPQYSDEKFIYSKKILWLLFAIAFIWCFCGGIGYFYYQSFDYHFRNAVFRDLINFDWPVFYDRANTPLVYYMAFWLVAAQLGKILLFLGFNFDIVFYVSNILLLIYAILGTVLIFCHIIKATGANSKKEIIIAVLGLVFFSGMDIIGYKFFIVEAQPFKYHLDWWATFIQYSSHTTSMFWVFNQFIPTALIILLFYNERNIKNFGFLIAMSLFFAPYPTAGIGVFMVAYAIKMLISAENKKDFILDQIFSVTNIIGVFWILPVVVLYFITNSEGMNGYYYVFNFTTPLRLLLFYTLEFLLYIVLIYPKCKKELLYWVIVVCLFLIPFMRVDNQNNFCMRASIPVIILLTILVIKSMLYEKNKIIKYLLITVFLIGSVTPMVEFYRGFYYVSKAKRINLVTDEIETLNKQIVIMPLFLWDANHQFTAKNYGRDIFWQWLAKETKGLNK
ncbi:MAG: hypothetical protein IKW39_05270 [Alphaproteobacteria bacterium]|nr:hypothetical protein [Alphaproteobacteria bacterium]